MRRAAIVCLAVFLCLPVSGVAGEGEKTFKDLTQGAVLHEGLFDVYRKGDHLYLAIPPDRLGRDMVLVPRLERGIGAAGLFGGLMFDRQAASIVALERHGDRVFLVKRAHRFTAPAGSAEAAALAISIGESVLQSAAVAATRPADDAVVIDIHEWMVSDLSNIDRLLRTALKPGRASLDRSRSYVEAVKSFPRNLEITARLTFTPSDPASFPSLPDPRYLPLGLHYSFADLPDQPMKPRLADDRMGYIHSVRKDFSRDEPNNYVRYANRWRLEPGEKVGDLWRPKKPIVYYVDRTVPERWRPWVEAGIEEWNRAFEAAGFKDAIRAEMLPADADASDLRYPTIRWITTDQPGFGGIGPSIVDPRTGEILDAEVLLDASMVAKFRDEFRNITSPATRLEALLAPGSRDGMGGDGDGTCDVAFFADSLAVQGSLLRLALAARGEIAAGEPTPELYLGQAVKYVTTHEVGHTLGLDHNFQASTATPLDKLHDKEWTREHGIAASVMDYVPVNLAPPGRTNGDFYDVSVGSYDRWVIAYGYTPDDERARELARRAAEPGHAFGSADDFYAAGNLDPRNNLWDIGSDPVAWGMERAAILRALWPRLPELVLRDDKSYADLTLAFDAMVSAYSETLVPALRTIGGQYRHRDHVGDPGARPPFAPVPRREQEKALAFLSREVFGETAFAISPALLRQLGGLAWDHWGSPGHFNGRLDFPFLTEILDLQRAFLVKVTDPYRLGAMRDAELKFGASQVLTMHELFAGVTRTVWSEAWTGPGRDVPALRRDLQRVWLDRMTELLVRPPDRMPADARALARFHLIDLRERLSKRLTPPVHFDAYTRAHLLDARERIDMALRAEYQIDPSAAAATPLSGAPARD